MINRTKQRLVARRLAATAGYEARSTVAEVKQNPVLDTLADLQGLPDHICLLRASHEAGHAIAAEVCENIVLGITRVVSGEDEYGYKYHGEAFFESLHDSTTEGGYRCATAAKLIIGVSGRATQELVLGDHLTYEDADAWEMDSAYAHMKANNYFISRGAFEYDSQSFRASLLAVDRAAKIAPFLLAHNLRAVLAVTKILYETGEASAEVVRQVVDSSGRVGAARYLDELRCELVELTASMRQQKKDK